MEADNKTGMANGSSYSKSDETEINEKETGKETLMNEESNEEDISIPWWPYFVLFFSVLAVSSAGAVMKSMDAAAPIARAGWRLQGTCFVLLPGFLWQFRNSSASLLKKFFKIQTLLFLLSSAIALGFHFGLWVYSIDSTSLPHSLLFVCTPPLFLVLFGCLKGDYPSAGEIYGMLLGMVGVCIMILGLSFTHHKENDVTFVGDASALMAALAFVIYLNVGSRLRAWMPLFMYALPVTLGASVALLLASWTLEKGAGMHKGKVNSSFGWLSKEFFLPNLYLSLGPGFVGHTGINAVLKHISPLLVSMCITIEPLLGSFIGWFMHVSEFPKLWTCVGGSLLIFGIMVVNFAGVEKHRRINQQDFENSSLQMQSFDEEIKILTFDDDDV